jgi:hypothetical protein
VPMLKARLVMYRGREALHARVCDGMTRIRKD